jgi:uncharacterized protein YicC (UPF0701 family)
LPYSRKIARKKYLQVAKQRKPRKRQIKKAIKEQINCLKRNMEVLDSLAPEMLGNLEAKHLIRLRTIRKVLEQQSLMQQTGSHSVENRIVNLRQPHVRPIVRGKVSDIVKNSFSEFMPR